LLDEKDSEKDNMHNINFRTTHLHKLHFSNYASMQIMITVLL